MEAVGRWRRKSCVGRGNLKVEENGMGRSKVRRGSNGWSSLDDDVQAVQQGRRRHNRQACVLGKGGRVRRGTGGKRRQSRWDGGQREQQSRAETESERRILSESEAAAGAAVASAT